MNQQKELLRENWRVIAGAGMCMFFLFGVPTYMMPILYGSVIDEFGWTRAQATFLSSMRFYTGAVIAVAVGVAADRFGARPMAIVAAVIAGGSLVSLLWIQTLAQYYLLGFFLGLSALTTMISMKTLLAGWFTRSPGVALGLALLGTNVAGAVIPDTLGLLQKYFDWRVAFASLSLGIWFIALPFFIFAVRDAPGDAATDGKPGRRAEKSPEPGQVDGVSPTLREFLRSRNTWLIGIGLLLVGAADMGIAQHTVLYLERDVGLAIEWARRAVAIVAIVGIFSKVGSGWVYDRISTKGVAITYSILFLCIAAVFSVTGLLTMFVFAFLRGTAHGGLVVGSPILSRHVYGPRNLGRHIGIFTAIYGIGLGTGPLILGRFHDVYGSYNMGFALMLGAAAVATVLMLQVRPYYWRWSMSSQRAES